jgi:hypothetical protein
MIFKRKHQEKIRWFVYQAEVPEKGWFSQRKLRVIMPPLL